jgi:hypothetical protein
VYQNTSVYSFCVSHRTNCVFMFHGRVVCALKSRQREVLYNEREAETWSCLYDEYLPFALKYVTNVCVCVCACTHIYTRRHTHTFVMYFNVKGRYSSYIYKKCLLQETLFIYTHYSFVKHYKLVCVWLTLNKYTFTIFYTFHIVYFNTIVK